MKTETLHFTWTLLQGILVWHT